MTSSTLALPERPTLSRTTAAEPQPRLVIRLGFWAALLVTVLNLAFSLALIAFPGPAWRGMYEFSISFNIVDLIPALPSLLLAPAIVALFVAIHQYAPAEKKVLGELGLVLAAIYAALCSTNYFLQLTVVRAHIADGETAGLALFVMANPGSVILAIDTLGYLFLFLAALSVAPLFQGRKLELAIQRLLLATSLLGLAGVVGYMLGQQAVYFAGLVLSGIAFLLATALIALLFRRMETGTEGAS